MLPAVVLTERATDSARISSGGRAPSRLDALAVFAALALLAIALQHSLRDLVTSWLTEEEYSHGILIPFVAIYLFLRRFRVFDSVTPSGSWVGVAIVATGTAIAVASELADVYTLAQYALIGILPGLCIVLLGFRGARAAAAPLLLLALAIPLPYYLQVALTSELQLVSSRLGVLAIAAMGIPVFLEGNLIDLGTYKLQVLEACSGLSYLFPLLSFAVMCACLFKGSAWQRAFIVLLAVPITILMNSLRIAIAGLLVDGYGPATAEGFIHNFEGWFVFVVSLAMLFGAMALLVRLGSGPARTLQEALDLGIPHLPREQAPMQGRSTPSIVTCTASLVVGAAAVFAFAHRDEQIPARTPLALFPSTIGDRHGQRGMLDRDTIRTLRLDDYYLAEYSATADAEPVELYLAYYDSQRDDSSPHSPKVCLPAGGWEIERFERIAVNVSTGAPVSLNRVVMHKGTHRLLAYYWFQQRGSTFANEYRMKWHLLKDAVLLNRTDGALVRLVTPIDADLATSQARLDAFLRDLWTHLPPFIPN